MAAMAMVAMPTTALIIMRQEVYFRGHNAPVCLCVNIHYNSPLPPHKDKRVLHIRVPILQSPQPNPQGKAEEG